MAHNCLKSEDFCPNTRQSHSHGFTLVEIIVVLLLLSIIAAAVLGRGITTRQTDLTAQVDRLRNQLNFVQSMAMKHSDIVWGIKCTASPNEYWMFSGTNPDNLASQVKFPGESETKISFAGSGVSISPAFTLFFDRIGKPYTAYTDASNNTPLASDKVITIAAGSESRTVTVTPETGFIQ